MRTREVQGIINEGRGLKEYYDFYGVGREVGSSLLVVKHKESKEFYIILGDSSPSKLEALCPKRKFSFPNADDVIGLNDDWVVFSSERFNFNSFY